MNGLAVIGDFIDSEQLETTEEWQEVTEYQLNYNCYIYLDTRNEMDGDELLVCKAMSSTCIPTESNTGQVNRSLLRRAGDSDHGTMLG